ncbi:putative transport protein [Rhodovulum sulfidophilum]|uniref:Putative transport protein n=1 Tax=Rhodovulum sulfidophilum TaxID=35806 RepID=A0A0D6AY90_RHOSU|nr:putative transport protein [Rhodovulum sulfidophilum]
MAASTQKKYEDRIAEHELEAIDAKAPIRALALFESIRREGAHELNRPASALALSGLTAGLAIGFSVLSEALLRTHLPDAPWRPLIENIGYSVGFVLVILGQLQLFTENTITAVCPVLDDPRPRVFASLARLWSLVLATNLIGAAAFGWVLHAGTVYEPELRAAVVALSDHATGYGWWETAVRGIGAGWLIAALVWVKPNARNSELLLIVVVTYLIALADFSHVIAGTTEAAVMVYSGGMSVFEALGGFVLPALVGNILGGTVFFTLLTYAQIRSELVGDPETGRTRY